MNTKSLRLYLSCFALFLLLFLAACEEENENNQLCDPNAFSIDLFEDNVIGELDGKVMGYSYVIMQDGQVIYSGAGGQATNVANGTSSMTIDDKIHIASISKFITTVAAMHLLQEDPNVDEDDLVIEYLPPQWTTGEGIETITFLDLLAQQAGLNVVGTQNGLACRFDSLALYVESGATQPKTKRYTNTHHGLMRVILPRLWDKYRPNDGIIDDDFTANVYTSLVQELLLEPIGITASCEVPANNLALAYANVTDTGSGRSAGNLKNTAGGYGWYMRSPEIAKLWAYAWYTNDFIDDNSRQIMTANTAGLWNTINGDKGTYFNKLGGWNWGSGESYNAIAMHYPNDVDLVVLTNSNHTDGTGLVALGRDTYDNSFGCQ